MARIRTVKPEFCTSEDVAALSIPTRLVFILLWGYVDDSGIGVANERLISSSLFPMDDPRESLAIVRRALDELSNGGQIVLYQAGGKRLLAVTGWHHQKIDRPTRSRYIPPTAEQLAVATTSADADHDAADPQPPPLLDEDSRGLDEGSSPYLGIKGSRDRGTEGAGDPARKRAAASRGSRLPDDWQPSPALREQLATECPGIDQAKAFRRFRDHFLAVPGAKGRKLDWNATYRNWIRRDAEDAPGPRRLPARSGTDQHAAEFLRGGTDDMADLFPATASGGPSPTIVEGEAVVYRLDRAAVTA